MVALGRIRVTREGTMDGGIRMVTEFGYFFWKNYWGIGLLNEELRKMSLCMQRNGLVDEKSRKVLETLYVMTEQKEGPKLVPLKSFLSYDGMNEEQTNSFPRVSSCSKSFKFFLNFSLQSWSGGIRLRGFAILTIHFHNASGLETFHARSF